MTDLIINAVIQVAVVLLIRRYYRRLVLPAGMKYDTFGARFWTGSVDNCVFIPIGFVFTALMSLDWPRPALLFFEVIQVTAWLVYTVWMHAGRGQTVGKMVCKIRVVDFRTEGPITFGQALLRESPPFVVSLLLLVLVVFQPASRAGDGWRHWLIGIPLIWFLIEVVTMFTNPKRRALHDLIAGTVVIRTNIRSGPV